MAMTDGAAAPDDAGPGAGPPPGGPPGPPGGGGGLIEALRAQQQGPAPSTPGAGNQASGMMLVKSGLDLFQQALGQIDHTTPLYRDVAGAMTRIARHLAQGSPTAGVQQTQLGDLMRSVMRSAVLSRLRGQQGQGQGPQPPMPSTPLPGA